MTPLFTLGIFTLTVAFPFFLLVMYRLLVIVLCCLFGEPVNGIVVSKQRNAFSSCYACHSAHRMQTPSNTNIELLIAFRRQDQSDYHVTMVEMPSSSYHSWARGTNVTVNTCQGCCCFLRAEPRLTCKRCCITLFWDRFLDFGCLVVVLGGCACLTLSATTGEEAAFGILAVVPIVTVLFLVVCCYCNVCFLRKNKYPQHLEEVIATDRETLLREALISEGPHLFTPPSTTSTDSSVESITLQEQEECTTVQGVELVPRSAKEQTSGRSSPRTQFTDVEPRGFNDTESKEQTADLESFE